MGLLQDFVSVKYVKPTHVDLLLLTTRRLSFLKESEKQEIEYAKKSFESNVFNFLDNELPGNRSSFIYAFANIDAVWIRTGYFKEPEHWIGVEFKIDSKTRKVNKETYNLDNFEALKVFVETGEK